MRLLVKAQSVCWLLQRRLELQWTLKLKLKNTLDRSAKDGHFRQTTGGRSDTYTLELIQTCP